MSAELVKFFEEERSRRGGRRPAAARLQNAKERWLEASADFDLKVQPGAAAAAAVFHFYAGPTSRQAFGEDRYDGGARAADRVSLRAGLRGASSSCGSSTCWKWLLGSAGIAVILMTLVVRGAHDAALDQEPALHAPPRAEGREGEAEARGAEEEVGQRPEALPRRADEALQGARHRLPHGLP